MLVIKIEFLEPHFENHCGNMFCVITECALEDETYEDGAETQVECTAASAHVETGSAPP